MSCRKHAPGDPCCRPFLCADNCDTVPVPATVSGTVPGEGSVTWSYPGNANPFSCDYELNKCYYDSGWTVYEVGECVSPWPPINSNNTRYAVGTQQACVQCDNTGTYDYTLWFEEFQVGNRVKSWYRRYWKYRVLIAPYGTDGTLRIELRITYGYCYASSIIVGARNRMKEVSIDCNPPPSGPLAGVVTALSSWQYPATDLNTRVPAMCVDVAVAGCFSETTATADQTCWESDALAGTHRVFSTSFGDDICTDNSVYLRIKEADTICNDGGFSVCIFYPLLIAFSLDGSNRSQCVSADKTWVKYIHCDDLYAGGITLDLMGGSVGGSISFVPSRSNPALVNLGSYSLDCEFTHTPDTLTMTIPSTITLTFA